MRIIPKPDVGEYPPYAEMYMKLLPDDGLILRHLADNAASTQRFLHSLPEATLYHRYEPGKWSIKETLVHVIDDERIFAYRALCFARNEQRHVLGFDQDAYAHFSEADARSLASILDEYHAVRAATIALFTHLPESSLRRMGHGTAFDNDATVRALAYHIAGHELHHIQLIKERYL